jgi:hypothetical protein
VPYTEYTRTPPQHEALEMLSLLTERINTIPFRTCGRLTAQSTDRRSGLGPEPDQLSADHTSWGRDRKPK